MLLIRLNPIKINRANVILITRLHPSITDVEINIIDDVYSFLLQFIFGRLIKFLKIVILIIY